MNQAEQGRALGGVRPRTGWRAALAATVALGAGVVSIATPIGADAAVAAAPTPILVDDVNTTGRGSSISDMVEVGGVLFFTADDGTHGVELWRYDGTNPPALVDDINREGSSTPTDLTDLGGKLYFTASDGADGREPWFYDPATPLTAPRRVADVAPLGDSSNATEYVAMGGRAYFVATDASGVPQLFTAGLLGAPTGAALVEPAGVGTSIRNPSELTVVDHTGVGETLWMVAEIDAPLTELVGLRADGSVHGLAIDQQPQDLLDVGGTLYYNDGALVRVDVLTDPAIAFVSGDAVGAGLVDLFAAGTQIFASNGVDLLAFDGTALDPVGPVPIGADPFSPPVTVAIGNTLHYIGDAGTGEALFRTSGAAVQLTLDTNPTAGQSSVFAGPWAADGKVYVVVNTGTALELRVVTTPPANIALGDLDIFLDTDVGGFVAFDGAIHLWGDLGDTGVELLSTPLTPAVAGPNLTLVADIVTGTDGSLPDAIGPAGSRIVWAATAGGNPGDPTADTEPYVYDPTPVVPTVGVLKNINLSGSSNPTGFTRVGALTLFQADDGVHGRELWVTNGTEVGTQLLADINPTGSAFGLTPDQFDGFVVVGSNAYFVAGATDDNLELWKTDGTVAGTSVVKEIRGGLTGSYPFDLVAMGGTLYFIANDGSGNQLWRSDGTHAGTTVVGTVTNVDHLVAADTYLVFAGPDGFGGTAPWTSDGSGPGTTPLPPLGTSPDALLDIDPRFTVVGGDVWFFAGRADAPFTPGLWKTSGDAGITQVFDHASFLAYLGEDPAVPAIAPAGNGSVVFGVGNNPDLNDYVLWRSDGTAAGTGPVADGYNVPIGYAVLNGWTYFTASTPAAGRELWRTADGVAVEQVSDFGDAADGVDTYGLWPVGDRLFFPGITPQAGTELWYVEDRPPVPATPAAPTAVGGLGAATVSWSAVADPAGAPVTGYTVTASGGQTCDGDDTDTSCTITGLAAGTSYTFTVVATNRIGNSAASAPSAAVQTFAKPAEPAAPTATAGLLSASVSWTAVANPAGAPVTGYTVVATPGSRTCTTTGTTCTVTNLVAGTPYTFQVKATNVVGDSALSSASNSVTPSSAAIPPSAPAAPAAPTAVAKVQSAQVSWTAVADPVGAAVTGYTVTAAPGGATCTTSGATTCLVSGLTAGTAYTFTVVATNSAGSSSPSPASAGVVPVPPAAVPLAPARLMDSRVGPAFLTVDGQAQGVGELAAGSVFELQVAGRGLVSASADAVMLNVTAVLPSGDGFLTVYPCGTTPPRASSVNYRAAEVVPNAVLAKIGTGGKVCIFTLATTHVLVDVSGFVPAGGSPSTVQPARLLETRSGDNLTTVDGQAQGVGRIAAGSVYELQVTGRGNVSASADAVMLNVTAVLPSGDGYLTVFPCGTTAPRASSVNYRAGEVVPNAVLAKIGTGGKVCIFTLAEVDLLVDVSGFVRAGASPSTVLPARLLETRSGDNLTTVDGQAQGVGRIAAGSVYELQVAGRGDVPADATAVMLNVTAVFPDSGGFVTVFPCGGTPPLTSSVNYAAGEVVPNAVLAKIGTGGKVCFFTTSGTDLLVDVNASIGAA